MGVLQGILEEVLAKADEVPPELSGKKLARLAGEMAKVVWKSLEKNKEETLFHNRLDAEAFTKRNVFRWREGLDLMEVLAGVSLEVGQSGKGEDGPGDPPSVDTKQNVLLRLHAKALQIFAEVICLLKHGFADGALGRWRALHEAAVMASLIAANDETLAQRFLDFRWVESWRRMKTYQHNAQRLGVKPFEREEMDQAHGKSDEMLAKYGQSFRGNYGWAASVVKATGREVSFRDIAEEVGIDHLKPYYQWACEKIHVGYLTVHKSLGLREDLDEQVMIAGPSNAGLCDPAHLSAISLHQVTCTLSTVFPSMDVLVGCKITEMLVEKIGDAFLCAHQQLGREEAELQRQAELEFGGDAGDPMGPDADPARNAELPQ